MFGIFCIVSLLLANLIHAPTGVPTDNGAIVVSAKSGGQRWTANWTQTPTQHEGKKAVRFTERGQGHLSPYKTEVRWSIESVWSVEPGLQPLDTVKTVTTADGAWVATERKHFDWKTGMVQFERRSSDGEPEIKSLSIPPDTLAVEGIAGVLRFLPFGHTTSFPAHLLTNEPRVYKVTFDIQGTEHVKTPAGEFDAYKVAMTPHLGVLNVLRAFLPRAFFWFNTAPPHFWVRYEGPENGLGSPDIVMELDRAQSPSVVRQP